MTKQQYKFIGLLVLTFLHYSVFAALHEEKKQEVHQFFITKQAAIELNNQYGEIQIVDWEKDSVKIEIEIIAQTDKYEDARKLLEMVEVIARGNESNVIVSTEWTTSSNIFKRGAMDLKNMFRSDRELTINYKVHMPKDCRLIIANRFGDVYLPNHNGPLRIKLSHGDLRAREIQDARSISIRYGKAIIKSINNGLVKVEYGSLILDNATNITLESRSSKIELLMAGRVAIKSRNDELRIEKVKSLRGSAYFSHLRVKSVSDLVDITTTYGDVSLREIPMGFEQIRMKGSSTDYSVEFLKEAACQFNVEMIGSKTFSYPSEIKVVSEKEVDKNQLHYEGYHQNKDAASKVEIQLKNGYLNFSVL